jgi:hypothetical protein
MDKAALGLVFSECFGFPEQISFHRPLHTHHHHHHLSSGAGTIDQTVADVPSGLSLTPAQETKKIEGHPHAVIVYRDDNKISLNFFTS